MVDQFEVALVGWHAAGVQTAHVVEHLVGGGFDDVDRAFADAERGRDCRTRLALRKLSCGGAGRTISLFVDDGFEHLDRRFLGGSADVAGADVVVVGKDAGDFAVEIDALDPVLLDVATLELAELQWRELGALLGG